MLGKEGVSSSTWGERKSAFHYVLGDASKRVRSKLSVRGD